MRGLYFSFILPDKQSKALPSNIFSPAQAAVAAVAEAKELQRVSHELRTVARATLGEATGTKATAVERSRALQERHFSWQSGAMGNTRKHERLDKT